MKDVYNFMTDGKLRFPCSVCGDYDDPSQNIFDIDEDDAIEEALKRGEDVLQCPVCGHYFV